MTRTIIPYPQELDTTNIDPHPGMETRTYEIEVITPIFGGGVEAGRIDPEHPIRESGIRGHLRFWWRATRGARFTDVRELLQREGEIWGSTENPSVVDVVVIVNDFGTKYPCMSSPQNGRRPQFQKDHPPYALFPFQGDRRRNVPIASCISGLSFTLNMIYPKSIEDEVRSAVRAWVNFGGIGARTRRGCGALYCKKLAPADEHDFSELVKSIQIYSEGHNISTPSWPIFKTNLLIKKTNNGVLQCWSEVIGLLKKFRQDPPVGRSSPGRFGPVGRSYWPEPEAIREFTKQRLSVHERYEHIPNNAFPRAEFGLPIVFHFKDNPDFVRNNPDPADTELYPVVNDSEKARMGSPLILRPLRCSNGSIFSVILRMRTPAVEEVVLKKAPKNPHCTKIRGNDLASYRNSPMGVPRGSRVKRSEKGSAIEAFISFAKNENGFAEVP